MTDIVTDSYIASSRVAFDRLCDLNRCVLEAPIEVAHLHRELTSLSRDAIPKLGSIYGAQLRILLRQSLSEFGAAEDTDLLERISGLVFYESGMTSFLSMLLFWAWENNSPATDSELAILVQAVLEGTIGYRLIDLHLDSQTLGPEVVPLGHSFVRRHEDRLAGLFGEQTSRPVFAKYARMYTNVEFREKKFRGKACPFSIDRIEEVGGKGAPLCAVLHLLMVRAGKSEAHIDTMATSMIRVLAVQQMLDDWNDALEDLTSGTETLATAGFYEWNQGHEITPERVRQFLDPAKLRETFLRTLAVLNSAIEGLERISEPILALEAEQVKSQLLRSIAKQASLRRAS